MKEETMNDIELHVNNARAKHPFFAKSRDQVVSLAAEEMGEFAQAINDNKPRREMEAEANLNYIAPIM